MTQEEKELLIKDLSGRLLYRVKFRYKFINNFFHEDYTTDMLKGILPPYHIIHSTLVGDEYLQIERDEVKPYLFPLSSMTEEQYNEFFSYYHNIEMAEVKMSGDYLKAAYIGDDAKYSWLNKNHFDYRGLIEKGLALDATGLNIY